MIGLVCLSGLAWGAGSLRAAEPATVQAEKNGASDVKSRPDGWRYVWHNNQWWYYTPRQHWLVYQGDSWQPYASEASGGTARNSGPSYRRSYSRSPASGSIYNPDLYTPYFGPPERIWLFRRLYGRNPI